MPCGNTGQGLVRVVLASGMSLGGNEPLLELDLHLDPSAPMSSTPLVLAAARLNDIKGQDFATSTLQRPVERGSGVLDVAGKLYLPLVRP